VDASLTLLDTPKESVSVTRTEQVIWPRKARPRAIHREQPVERQPTTSLMAWSPTPGRGGIWRRM